MKLIVVDAPGLLYPEGHCAPNADPLPSGIDFARRIMQGYGASTIVIAHDDSDVVELRSWMALYKVSPSWVLVETPRTSTEDFITKVVLNEINRLGGTPALLVTANRIHSMLMVQRNIPAALFIKAADGVPDWKTRGSSWVNEVDE